MIGAKFNGQKELLAMGDGVRESEASWKKLLLELKGRGMSAVSYTHLTLPTNREV